MKKLTKKQETIRELLLQYPTATNAQIAEKANCTEMYVSTLKKQYIDGIDRAFVEATVATFIAEIGQAKDHWKKLISEIEELKSTKKTIFKKGADGQTYPEKIDLEPHDKLALIQEQARLRERIVYIGGQTEIRHIIQAIRNAHNE